MIIVMMIMIMIAIAMTTNCARHLVPGPIFIIVKRIRESLPALPPCTRLCNFIGPNDII